jgi:hypothetical protein
MRYNRFMVRRTPRLSALEILRLLIDARGGRVLLPEIMACAAQYNARILELRRMRFNIENRTERVDGARHSWLRLISSPPHAPKPAPAKAAPTWPPRTTGLLFDLEPRT